MKKLGMLAIIFSVVLSGFFCKSRFMANAQEDFARPVCERFYKNITVQKGDSLWSIAEQYKDPSDMTTSEYVRELKHMNRLNSDRINAGDCLAVVYFAETPPAAAE